MSNPHHAMHRLACAPWPITVSRRGIIGSIGGVSAKAADADRVALRVGSADTPLP